MAKHSYVVSPLMAALLAGSACAMNSPPLKQVVCRVIGGSKLPTETGGPDALCAAITRAAAIDAPASKFSVEVRVINSSSLAATLKTADGTTLPEQRFAISDRGLTKGAIERFAKSLVGILSGGRAR